MKKSNINVWTDDYGHTINVKLPKNWGKVIESQNAIFLKLEIGDAKRLKEMLSHHIYMEEWNRDNVERITGE